MYFPRQDDIGHFAWLQERKARIVAANPHFASKILGASFPDPAFEPPLPRPVLAGEGYIGGRKRRRCRRPRRDRQAHLPAPPPALYALAMQVAAACDVTLACLRGRHRHGTLTHARACVAVLAQEFLPDVPARAVDTVLNRSVRMTEWYRQAHARRLRDFPDYAALFSRCRALHQPAVTTGAGEVELHDQIVEVAVAAAV